MSPGGWHEMFVLLGGFMASAFAVAKLGMGQQKGLADQFLAFVQDSLRHQESLNERFAASMTGLENSIRENTEVVRRLSERMGGGTEP